MEERLADQATNSPKSDQSPRHDGKAHADKGWPELKAAVPPPTPPVGSGPRDRRMLPLDSAGCSTKGVIEEILRGFFNE